MVGCLFIGMILEFLLLIEHLITKYYPYLSIINKVTQLAHAKYPVTVCDRPGLMGNIVYYICFNFI